MQLPCQCILVDTSHSTIAAVSIEMNPAGSHCLNMMLNPKQTAGKTLKEQAEVLSQTHIYILFHGAAMALYMFLPRHAAIIEVSSHIP